MKQTRYLKRVAPHRENPGLDNCPLLFNLLFSSTSLFLFSPFRPLPFPPPQLSKTSGCKVFATDTILSTLMTCARSSYSWDIVVQVGTRNVWERDEECLKRNGFCCKVWYVFMCVGFYFSRGLRTCGSLTREIAHCLVRSLTREITHCLVR